MRIKWKKYLHAFFLVLLFPLAPFHRRLNDRLQTTRYTVRSRSLPSAFDGFRIVQISDLHNKSFGKACDNPVSAAKRENPDLIIITGDLIDSNRTDVDSALRTVRGLLTISPVYYVTGNHEAKTKEYVRLKEELRREGVILADGKRFEIERNGQKITLYGLGEYRFTCRGLSEDERNARLKKELKELRRGEDFSVLLSHHPELFELYADSRFDLIFCGHAHGGQIRIAEKGLFAPDQGFLPHYTSGIYTKENSRMVVSRGLGNSAFPYRINNPPEITSVRLEKE